jgi:hypothetical protein
MRVRVVETVGSQPDQLGDEDAVAGLDHRPPTPGSRPPP